MAVLFLIDRPPHFAPRVREVIARVAAGESNKEIGDAMGISVDTVKMYCHRVYDALGYYGAGSRVKLARRTWDAERDAELPKAA